MGLYNYGIGWDYMIKEQDGIILLWDHIIMG
jgi:hypothetical protein